MFIQGNKDTREKGNITGKSITTLVKKYFFNLQKNKKQDSINNRSSRT